MVREGDCRSSATPVPHGAIGAYDVDDTLAAETVEAIAVGVVSPMFASWNQAAGWLRRLERLRCSGLSEAFGG